MDVFARNAPEPSGSSEPEDTGWHRSWHRTWVLGSRSLGVALVLFAVIAAVQLDAAIANTPGRFSSTDAGPLPGLLLAFSDSVAPWVGALLGCGDAAARMRSIEWVTLALVVLGVALVVLPRSSQRSKSAAG